MGLFGGKSAKYNQMGALGALSGVGGMASGMLGGGGMFGKGESIMQAPLYDQQGMDTMHWLQQQGRQNANWGDIEKNEVNRFNTQTIPGLAERFTAMGDSGQRSSGFQQALGMASSDLGQNLAGMRSQFGMQQLGMGLHPQFENVFRPRQAGGMEQGLGAIMQLLPMLAFL